MTRYVHTPISSGLSAQAAIDQNFEDIEANLANTLSRTTESPNMMQTTLDMNSQRIINLPNASASTEPLTYGQWLAAGSPATYYGAFRWIVTATVGQTVFTGITPAYSPGIGNLTTYVNGVYQSGVVETSSTVATLPAGIEAGDEVVFIINQALVTGSIGSTTAALTSAIVGGASTTVETALNADIVTTSVATLKAIASPTDGALARTHGYYTANDGGHGIYRYDLASVATANNGTVVTPNSGTGRWLLQYVGTVNVKQFGAKGDGVATDTSAIQASLDASLSVFIPVGTYIITSTLTLRANHCVTGATMLGTVLQANTDITVMSGTNLSQVVLENFEIFGIGKATSTKYGIQWVNTPNSLFSRLYIIGFAKGIYFKAGGTGEASSFSCCINNSIVHYNTVNIDAEVNAHNLTVYATRFGSASTGIKLLDCNTLAVIGGDCEGCTTAAIHIDAALAATEVGASITGTHFEGNTSASGDIIIGGTNQISGVAISGNLFYGSPGNATPLSILYGSGVTFSGNTVFGTYASNKPTLGTTANVAISGNHPLSSIPNLITGGLTFPATQVPSTDLNTLDDYEEGTWTPAWTNLTVVGTPTYTGRFIKVGKLVTCFASVSSTTTTASTAGSTTITAASMPYAMDANPANYAGVTAANAGTIASYGVGIVNAATSTVYPPTWAATASVGITFSYMAAN